MKLPERTTCECCERKSIIQVKRVRGGAVTCHRVWYMYNLWLSKLPALKTTTTQQVTKTHTQARAHARMYARTHTHTHTHLTAPFPGLPGWVGTRKVKPSGFYWSKRQRVAVASAGSYASCISLQTDNHVSTPLLSFLQTGCPSCRPTNSVKALKALLQKVTKVYNINESLLLSYLDCLSHHQSPIHYKPHNNPLLVLTS